MRKIDRKNLPVRAPTLLTAVAWLLADRLNAPDLVWGIVCTLLGILWVGWAYAFHSEVEVDVVAAADVAAAEREARSRKGA